MNMNFITRLKQNLFQKMLRLIKKMGIVSLPAFFLFVQWGCAHNTTHPILSESIQEDIQHIGVVVRENQGKSLQDSQGGVLSSMGKGAARGSLLGGAGLLCYGPAAIVCIPVLAAAGAVGGSVYGVYQASSETIPTEVESTLGQAIIEVGLGDLLVRNLVLDAQAWGYPLEAAKNAPLPTGEKQEGESPALRKPFDTLLEIEGPVVNLLPTTFENNPPRRVGFSARVQVIRTADQEVLEDRIVLEELGKIHSLEEWTAHQAQHFREELPRASRRLSERIITDFFMGYTFEERTHDFALFGPGHGWGYRLRGLASPHQIPESPDPLPNHVDSLRPTLRWERFEGSQVTYDLRIWESKQSRANVGEVVYEREGLTENMHTLESPLKPSNLYTWSVRTRFVQDGKVRVTEWTQYKLGITTFLKIISLGMFALVESFLGEDWDWGYYQIKTP